jgi:Methyltransferase domain
MLQPDTFLERISTYENTAIFNDTIHQEFSRIIIEIPFLNEHRQHIEQYQLGFGDRAFHYMWFLIIQYIAHKFPQSQLLEIGVFKGQVISLWSLIAKQLSLDISITGISPLKGNPLPKSVWVKRFKQIIDSQFRRNLEAGNFYPDEDYKKILENLFSRFNLDFSDIRILQGYSTDETILSQVQQEKFSLIYFDGDHTYEGVIRDLENYTLLVEPNGLIIMDDASYYLPGEAFWKGHETVSRACDEVIASLGFTNIWNIGHNRIYQKVG